MSILGVAIVPPHPTVLSLRMAVAIYVTGISTPDLHLESPPLLGTLTRTALYDEPEPAPREELQHVLITPDYDRAGQPHLHP
jgi:hypothetical protein